MRTSVTIFAAVALGFALGRGDGYAFVGVVCAALAASLLTAVLLSSFVVVQLGRAQAPPADAEDGSRP